MTARNATTHAGDWEESASGNWDDQGYYTEAAQQAPAVRPELLRRIWTGRPMIYILAVALVGVTALVLLTRPDATPAPAPAAAVTTNAPPLITYDAGPVIDNEFNKP